MRKTSIHSMFNKKLTDNQKLFSNTVLKKYPKIYNSEPVLDFIKIHNLVNENKNLFHNNKTKLVDIEMLIYNYCKVKQIPYVLTENDAYKKYFSDLYQKKYRNLKNKQLYTSKL